jgi:hypothetical protein
MVLAAMHGVHAGLVFKSWQTALQPTMLLHS